MPMNSKSGRSVILRSAPGMNDVTRLQLLKPLPSLGIAKTLGKIGAGGEVPNADKLDDPVKRLSHYFSEPPVEDMVHLIVQLPPSE
jgi:hypothetical protein